MPVHTRQNGVGPCDPHTTPTSTTSTTPPLQTSPHHAPSDTLSSLQDCSPCSQLSAHPHRARAQRSQLCRATSAGQTRTHPLPARQPSSVSHNAANKHLLPSVAAPKEPHIPTDNNMWHTAKCSLSQRTWRQPRTPVSASRLHKQCANNQQTNSRSAELGSHLTQVHRIWLSGKACSVRLQARARWRLGLHHPTTSEAHLSHTFPP